jgi:two-component system response regulator YesN
MYRVMIVDDEEPVLDSFSFIFSKYVTDFTLCGNARSGTEAINEIKEKTPDLVFMDIQMPGLDGIETIKHLGPLFPDIIFILATAYERFDIAQKAIDVGVFSYLVKPISRRKILEELEKVKKYLDQRKIVNDSLLDDEHLREKTKNEIQRRFLSSLIWKNPDDDSWSEFARLFSINSERAAIYLVGGIQSLSKDFRNDLYRQITQTIQYRFNCLSTILGDKLLVFFPEERQMKDLETQFREVLDRYTQYNLILGTGNVCHYSELTRSYSMAFLPFSDSESTRNGKTGGQQKIESVFKGILTSEREKGEEQFKNFWMEIFKNDIFSVAKGKMVALFTLLLQYLDHYILINRQFYIDPAEEIMPLETMEEWQIWVAESMKELFNLLEMKKSHSYPKPLKKALSFIAENYKNQIQLTSVAEECMVTGSYLSRLFTEHLGMKFIDYINSYRINHAVRLLREDNISIKEVSYLVGFVDPNYFSRIFRKYMGVAPSELNKIGT